MITFVYPFFNAITKFSNLFDQILFQKMSLKFYKMILSIPKNQIGCLFVAHKSSLEDHKLENPHNCYNYKILKGVYIFSPMPLVRCMLYKNING